VSEQPAVVINFPRPTSANRMFSRQMTRHGHRDLTPEYKAWRDEAGWAEDADRGTCDDYLTV
jgi:hypothetical protein